MKAKQSDEGQVLRAHATVHDAAAAIDFYAKAFGAKELFRLTEPSGKVGHAEIRIGDSLLMLNDEYPDFGARSPAATGGSPVAFYLQVPDADAAVEQAVAAGATVVRPVQDQFYGDRMGMVACPFGYRWSLSARKEEVSPAEMQKRWNKMLAGGKQ
ncbi:MAG: VOC family protein [Reyranella sp.]|nr:VOC family protein [Reyranella sp.]